MQEWALSHPKNEGGATVQFTDQTPDQTPDPKPAPPKPAARRKSLQHRSQAAPRAALPFSSLARWGQGWLLDCELRRHSAQTGGLRRMILKNLGWLATREGWTEIGTAEVREFLAYLSKGHLDEGGRWGNPQMTRPVRPITVHTYHGTLKTFFTWLVTEGVLGVSPMATIRAPVARASQIQPFTSAQVEALLSATGRAWQPERDAAMLWLLLDTGVRAAELCALTHADLDMAEKRIAVRHGKGDKGRVVYFGLRTGKALWRYLHSREGRDGEEEDAPDAPLFPSENGARRGEALSPRGLGQAVERLGERAAVSGVRCSPHTFRHTFAVSFLRAGGQVYALKEILGHTNIKQTLKYVALADADLAGQRRYSPGDRMRGKPAPVPKAANAPRPKPAPRPESFAPRKLSPAQVREIRLALTTPEPRKAIAERFAVSVSTLKDIRSGAIWADVK